MPKQIVGQAFRYAVAAGIVFVAALPFSFILIYNGVSVPMTGNALVVPVVISKFLLYKYWVFKNNLPRWIQQPTLFLTIVIVGYSLFLGIQYGQIWLFGVSEWWAFGIATVIIGTLRFLFFRKIFASEPPAA